MTFSGSLSVAIKICYRAVVENGQSAPAKCGFAGDPTSVWAAQEQALARILYILGMPPPGNIPPMPRIILAIPPFAENFFIIFCICLCCLIKRPMSCT
ncbi:hypothetical protein ABH912_005162 [Pseudomonas sp. BT76 TE3572]